MKAKRLDIIGIAGLARAGKDTFCSKLIDVMENNGLKGRRLAFADLLKDELNDIISTHIKGVNLHFLSGEVKEIYRPLMIAWGELRRKLSNNKYWIDYLHDEIESLKRISFLKDEAISSFIIPDVRYPNEIEWIKSNNGVVIYISKYIKDGDNVVFQTPKNSVEIENNDVLKEMSDYFISWEHGKNNENRYLVQDFFNKTFLK